MTAALPRPPCWPARPTSSGATCWPSCRAPAARQPAWMVLLCAQQAPALPVQSWLLSRRCRSPSAGLAAGRRLHVGGPCLEGAFVRMPSSATVAVLQTGLCTEYC